MSLSSGPNLGLLISGSQGEQHYNELLRFFRGVDGLVLLSVKSKALTTPPSTPSNGDRFLVSAGAAGAWTGRDGAIARYNGTAWEYFTPREGWLTHVDDEDAFYKHTGAGWELHLGKASGGWASATGTASRAAFDTSTVTLTELAQRVKALIDDLKQQGRLTA